MHTPPSFPCLVCVGDGNDVAELEVCGQGQSDSIILNPQLSRRPESELR